MGRRPNVIVSEFFERGEKLEDSSNRYKHTCRRCGTLFPKGRVDHLLSHLLKSCPNVTQEDRNLVMLHSAKSDLPKQQTPQHMMPPFTLERQISALDTLAEVSRRHLDYSSQRNAFDQNLLQDQALAEQALWAQLQQHNLQQQHYDLTIPREYDQVQYTTNEFTDNTQELLNLASLDPQLGSALPVDDKWTATEIPPKTRAKQRGRFSETRRKEVQNIRKQGACMRCRMLKKPCSEGTPCNMCANVDTARLWKGRCVRTRLDQEFTAWESGYFQASSRSKVQAATADMSGRHILEKVHVKLSICSGTSFNLLAMKYTTLGTVDPELHTSSGIIILQDSRDDLPDAISAYLMSDTVIQQAIASERHAFLRATLQESVDLLTALEEQSTNRTDARSCYNIATFLTRDTLELWMLTNCLVASHHKLQGTHSATKVFQVNSTVGNLSKASQDVIQSQLLASVETRAGKLSKKVLSDVERRLLQRQQVSGFATYIAAVVLLSCVERMTAFYHSFDPSPELDTISKPSSWPLEAFPRTIWSQGPAFAALLATLLRVRGLSPKTEEDDQGYLVPIYEPMEKTMKINGSATEEQLRTLEEERRVSLNAWLDRCKITAAEVTSWVEDDSKDWFGKFVAALLIR